MKIYIASSWRNEHGVTLLTESIRKLDPSYEVVSWIENNYKERSGQFVFEDWIKTEDAVKSFEFDTFGAMNCDVFIYFGPAGKDACAELGAAYGARVRAIVGLHAKSEDLGLMRKMAGLWFQSTYDLIGWLEDYREYFIAAKQSATIS